MANTHKGFESIHADEEPFLNTCTLHTHPERLPPIQRRKSATISIWIWILKDLTIVVLAMSALFHTYRGSSGREEYGPCDCGDSVDQAKNLGCEYDTMAAAWLPPHCIDKDLLAQFDKDGDGPGGRWQYWADANHTKELSLEEVGELADTPGKLFWTTPRWHFMHCFYYWRKLQRSQVTGVKIEARYNNERHVTHCGKMFENPGEEAFSYVELKSSNTEPPEFVKDLQEQ
ncbi:hypothetical protein N0V82_001977 [Gnomoniopsis sp. IMI 355080]|nr:hypothetical protein N0V82_001977 [Gnomoniopsis sp. IMI 355080]